jgi:hypothetical protein
MSNNYRLCVKINNKFYYYPCRWNDGSVEVYKKKKWLKVWNTENKNKYNECIFELKG